MSNFSSQTISILATAGWYEDRKVDVTSAVRHLEQEGYEIFPVTKVFLEQFGGLILRRQHPLDSRLLILLDLRIEQILLNFKRWRIEAYKEDLGVGLCPIGEDNSAIIYVMDLEGKVYGLYETLILLIGESGKQAIEHFCHWSPSNPFSVILDTDEQS